MARARPTAISIETAIPSRNWTISAPSANASVVRNLFSFMNPPYAASSVSVVAPRSSANVLSMRIGVMLEGQEGLTWDRWFRIADRVESLGLDSLWRSDHFFSLMGHPERAALECWTSLTALAQRTQRFQFGPLVSPMTFRHPALLARMEIGR